MRSDVIIEGRHANIINDIRNSKVLKNSNADLFFIAVLKGLFDGKFVEVDIDETVKSEISRTWLNSSQRVTLKLLINTFVNLQQKMDNEPLSILDIFNDEESTNSNEKMILIKKYGLHGLELMEKELFNDSSINDEIDVINYINSNLKSDEEIKKEANSYEFSSFTDQDILDIMESMED